MSARFWVRAIGFGLGVVLAGASVTGWRVAGGDAASGAEVSVTVNRTGELGIAPAGRLLAAERMLPGPAARARVIRFAMTNLTGERLVVRLGARARERDLDGQLALRIVARSRVLFAGSLGELRAGTRRGVRLAPGRPVPLAVHVWLPRSHAHAYEARSAHVSLSFLSRPAAD